MKVDAFKFWMVWCPAGRQPIYRHSSEESARAEAERLARQNQESEFYVLEATARVKVDSPPIVVTPLTENPPLPSPDDVPF